MLSVFYQWAVAEGHASAVPFTYAQALSRYGGQVRLAQANLARRRTPKPHVKVASLGECGRRQRAQLRCIVAHGVLPDP